MAREHSGEFLCVDGHVSVDQQPFIKAIVNGSKQISRDLLEDAESVLDPEGDKAFAREAAKGRRDLCMCSCPTHRGSPWLPYTMFSTDPNTPTEHDRYCLACRKDAAYKRRLREAERRGVRLRDKPGQPPKMKGHAGR